MTLFEKFTTAVNTNHVISSNYELMVDYNNKFNATNLIMSDIMSKHKDFLDNFKLLQMEYFAKFQKYKNSFFSELNKLIDLSKIKNIQTYTEFDFVKWHVEYDGSITVAFKPKNIDVSFWTCELNDMQWDN